MNAFSRTLFAASALAIFAGSGALAQDLSAGERAFRESCAACHGISSRGNGELAPFLTILPSDLTTLARDNGGAYPALQIYRVIDGREVVNAHGARAMPIWGARFSTDAIYGPYTGETAIQARILELVYYLETLQRD